MTAEEDKHRHKSPPRWYAGDIDQRSYIMKTIWFNATIDCAGDCHQPMAHQSHDRITFLL